MYILGVSCFYHDSAAVLLCDQHIVAAAQEERLTRVKNDSSFPINAIKYCLKEGGIRLSDLQALVYYEDPKLKFSRILLMGHALFPKRLLRLIRIIFIWFLWKQHISRLIRSNLSKSGLYDSLESMKKLNIVYWNHHRSHAASAFFPSPHANSAVLCVDGVGEYDTTSAWEGEGNNLVQLWSIKFPNSIGLFYAAITQFLGFRVNSGEYKVMGLAPYGRPVYENILFEKLFYRDEKGFFQLNMIYFDFMFSDVMYSPTLVKLLGISPRNESDELTQVHMDIAASLQKVTERLVIDLVVRLRGVSISRNLCLSGGVALNCVLNGVISNLGLFDHVWIQPAAGDSGSALGCALDYYFRHTNSERKISESDSMQGSFLGPAFSSEEIKFALDGLGIKYDLLDSNRVPVLASKMLQNGNIIGWFKGRMEFGPRALGARSILGDARRADTQSRMNLKIKYRESFRPFAPIVLESHLTHYFDVIESNPYMQVVCPVKKSRRLPVNYTEGMTYIDRVNQARSDIPAVTHLDFSARVQSVDKVRNPQLHELLSQFYNDTGCAVLVNTSFNVRGEPIVCSPSDALACFLHSDIDYLFLENYLVVKRVQDPKVLAEYKERKFDLD